PTPPPATTAPRTPAPPLPDPDPQAARPAVDRTPVASQPVRRPAAKPQSVELLGRLESLGKRADAKPIGDKTVVATGAAVPEPGQGWTAAKQVVYDEPVAKSPAEATVTTPAAGSGWRNTRQ
ncbi:MAG: hypothetical protein U1E05_08430, partial [Patescibacteria group bacterium]|nr:hypothetical protein [Patescibacteria group bacterium]